MVQIKRQKWIELLRILAIFLVVCHHATSLFFKQRNLDILSNGFVSFIFSISAIAVPIFFMISGYLLLDKNDNKQKYISRLTKLIIPLLIWSIIYALYPYQSDYYSKLHDPQLTIESLKLLWFSVTRKGYHLWFLYTLTGFYLVMPILKAFTKSLTKDLTKFFLLAWLVNNGIIFLNIWLVKTFSLVIGWQVGISFFFIYLGYFMLGKLLINHKNILFTCQKFLIIFIVSSFSLWAWSMIWHKRLFNFYPINEKNPLIMIASLCFFIIFYLTREHSLYSNPQIQKIVSWLSSITYSVYLIHVICLDLVMSILEKVLISKDTLYLSLPIVIMLTYILSMVISSIGKIITSQIKFDQYLFP